MIIELKKGISKEQTEKLAQELNAFTVQYGGVYYLVNSSKENHLSHKLHKNAQTILFFTDDIQLASKQFLAETREVKIGSQTIGGKRKNCIVIAGPCSIESEKQITQTAELLKEMKVHTIRAGCYKPRTSPYSFQGMGLEGLKLLAKVREKYKLTVVTEVRDATHVDEVIEYSDVVQIGAKSMYDHGILRRCAAIKKPVLLKRGFGTTLQELVQVSEFILSGGNPNVILCERGIRTFETKTRFTLDLCGVAYLKEHSNLPVILDPSHAMGYAYGVPDLARACTAMGVDGLLIEVHPDPKSAKSDASQQLNHGQFRELYKSLKPIARAVGQKLV